MDQQARAAFVIAQAACANAEIAAMQAANEQALVSPIRSVKVELPFKYADFVAVIDKYQIGWNSVISYLREG